MLGSLTDMEKVPEVWTKEKLESVKDRETVHCQSNVSDDSDHEILARFMR
jgi:hypothetical protein